MRLARKFSSQVRQGSRPSMHTNSQPTLFKGLCRAVEHQIVMICISSWFGPNKMNKSIKQKKTFLMRHDNALCRHFVDDCTILSVFCPPGGVLVSNFRHPGWSMISAHKYLIDLEWLCEPPRKEKARASHACCLIKRFSAVGLFKSAC
jgi:hypothetical protein